MKHLKAAAVLAGTLVVAGAAAPAVAAQPADGLGGLSNLTNTLGVLSLGAGQLTQGGTGGLPISNLPISSLPIGN